MRAFRAAGLALAAAAAIGIAGPARQAKADWGDYHRAWHPDAAIRTRGPSGVMLLPRPADAVPQAAYTPPPPVASEPPPAYYAPGVMFDVAAR
jgi:hypothetical protein